MRGAARARKSEGLSLPRPFGHVRQLDRVLDVALARAWDAGAGPGDGPLVIDLDSFIGEVHGYDKQGRRVGIHIYGYRPIIATRADTDEVLHIRCRKGSANTHRGAERFVDELLARVHRAGHSGEIVLRADSGFQNHKLMRALDRQGVQFSIGVKQSPLVMPGRRRPPPRSSCALSTRAYFIAPGRHVP